jgi:hypothetical protein
MPFFSPDEQSNGSYFSSERKIKRIALAGGTAVTICDADVLYGATWAASGDIYFGQFGAPGRRGIFRVPASGGKPEPLYTPTSTLGPDGAAAIAAAL